MVVTRVKRAKTRQNATAAEDGATAAEDGSTSVRKKKLDKRLVVDHHAGEDALQSDEEDGELNRVGNIDLSLYEDEEHVGYDIAGNKIDQVMKLKESEIDNLLRYADDPDAWRTVVDAKNQTEYRISDAELEIIRRLKEGRLGLTELNEEDFQVEFEWTENQQPLKRHFSRKGKFLPGEGEEKKIRAILKAIREGRYYSRREKHKSVDPFDVWGENITVAYDKKGRPLKPILPAPKLPPPGHAESYNPSPEYLFDEEEKRQWEEAHPDDKKYDFIPTAHKSLRQVPGYAELVKEKFKRCLDLYLCPRSMRLNWIENSDDLLPELPSLDNFKPFPRTQGIVVKDHGSSVVSLAFCRHSGVLGAGYRDGSLAIHNVASHPHYLPEFYAHTKSQTNAYAVESLAFHPVLPLMVFSRGSYLYITLVRRPQTSFTELRAFVKQYWGVPEHEAIDPADVSPHLQQYREAVDAMRCSEDAVSLMSLGSRPSKVGQWKAFRSYTFFEDYEEPGLGDDEGSIETEGDVEDSGFEELQAKDWVETCRFVDCLQKKNKYVVAGFVVALGARASAVAIHPKGAYVATAAATSQLKSSQCLLHHLKKKKSLAPFRKTQGMHQVESVAFHPTKPYLVVGYPKATKVFDLQPKSKVHIASAEHDKESKSMAHTVHKFRGTDQATGMELHPSGEHIIRTGVDGKFQWFDTQYSELPYKTISVAESLTAVKHHPYLPLVAAGSSESSIQLFHAAEDSLTEIKINPLVKLVDHTSHVTALAWAPNSHWLASGHSNGRIVVWV
ncbi:BOP1NT (NUC169) domain protein [Gregarina niphandrodes]|uniref:BOP1NT (NUC169) domain protein n=1 Tax=Gregarina niphandrodes TaxID=110365 RepID=A0A023B4V1_GRENI|nr:BOP1NT (NUC169) domain protein [Gregarina niphandrodes]EZG56794.1 BOP1NT (NUC169) domain protein [Gregarina niphandrodes]|eukprot:XP_011131160.1 BOP1NT (NUC169) domain protein [Gregarina niphandrodes]